MIVLIKILHQIINVVLFLFLVRGIHMRKLLFVLPLSFCLGSETMVDAIYRRDKYSELVSEFKETVELFFDQTKKEFQYRFEEAWENQYPNILLKDFCLLSSLYGSRLESDGVLKFSGEKIDREILDTMVRNVIESVISEEDFEHLRNLFSLKIRLDLYIEKGNL